jgi:hypothetical protein
VLNLSVLSSLRTFKKKGNKAGAIAAWKVLEQAGLGTVKATKALRGTDMVRFSSLNPMEGGSGGV